MPEIILIRRDYAIFVVDILLDAPKSIKIYERDIVNMGIRMITELYESDQESVTFDRIKIFQHLWENKGNLYTNVFESRLKIGVQKVKMPLEPEYLELLRKTETKLKSKRIKVDNRDLTETGIQMLHTLFKTREDKVTFNKEKITRDMLNAQGFYRKTM